MAEVDQDGQDYQASSPTKSRGAKRMRYYKNYARERIETFDMLVRCPQEDPNCSEFRKIKVYIQDRKQIWLDIQDVEWALRYLYVQHLLNGVPLVPEDSTGPGPVP